MRCSLIFLFLGLSSWVVAESIFQLPDLPRRLSFAPPPQECVHKGERYAQGQSILTDEACLNCTCNRVVLCYLRVCPTAAPLPPGCFPAREPGECCPTSICGGSKPGDKPHSSPGPRPTFQPFVEETTGHTPMVTTVQFPENETPMITIQTSYRENPPLEDINVLNLLKSTVGRTNEKFHETTVPLEKNHKVSPTTETSKESVDYFTTTLPPSTKSETVFRSTLSPADSFVFVTSTRNPLDDDINLFNDIPGGCVVNGTFYGDGSAMVSNTVCEYCFCIRNKTTCIKPKCHMTIEGCVAHYDSHSCCPSNYDCTERLAMLEANGSLTTTTIIPKTTKIPGYPGDCLLDGKIYRRGELIHTPKPCHNCFCSDSSVVCERIQCGPPIPGCQPIIPEGHCCPVSYRCDYQPEHSENNKIKGSKGNDNSTSALKGSDIKTVKNYYFSNNDDSNLKANNDKEFTSSLHKIIPSLRRRSNNTFHVLNTTMDDITPIRIGQGVSKTTDIVIEVTPDSVRENDKSLYIDLPTTVLQPGKSNSKTVLVGSPVMHTLSGNPHQLFDQLFSRQHESVSKVPNEMSHGPKRSNSKQPVSIVNIYDSETEAPHSTTAGSNIELFTTPMFNKNNAAETTRLSSTYQIPINIDTSATILSAEDPSYVMNPVQIPTIQYQYEPISSELNTESTHPAYTTTVKRNDFTEQLKKDLISNDAVETFISVGLTDQDFSTTTLSTLLKISDVVDQHKGSSEVLSLSPNPSSGFMYSEIPEQTYTTRPDYTTTKHTLTEERNTQKTTKPFMLIYSNTKKISSPTSTANSQTPFSTPMLDTRNHFEGDLKTVTESTPLKVITNHPTTNVPPSQSVVYMSTQNKKITKIHTIHPTPPVYTTDRNINTEAKTDSSASISNDYKKTNAQSNNPSQSIMQTPQRSDGFNLQFAVLSNHPEYSTTRNETSNDENKSTLLYVSDVNAQSNKDIEFRPVSSTFGNTENIEEKHSTETESIKTWMLTTLKDMDVKGSSKPTDMQENSSILSSNGNHKFSESQDHTFADHTEETLVTASSSYQHLHQTLPPLTSTELDEQMLNEKQTPSVDDVVLEEGSQKDSPTTEKSKLSTRINSKLPSFNTALKTNIKADGPHHLRDPITHSDANLYLPIEGRENVDDDDFHRTVYLGAPLSVGGTYNEKGIERHKITQSGGVIFMDPTYTDLISSSNPGLVEKEKNDTDIRNPLFEVKDPVNTERKKSPRIQDAQNQSSTGQAFKIIPFVAEDAVRGQFGKLNSTLIVQQGPTEEPDIVADFCFIKGRIHKNGETVGKPDPCEICRCFYGRELCHRQSCPNTPPDCAAERVPGFCCPRFTCGNASSNEHIHKELNPTSFVQAHEVRTSTTRKPDFIERIPPTTDKQEVKFGIRVRARPTPPVRTEYTTEKKVFRERSTIKPEIQTIPFKAFPPPLPSPTTTSTSTIITTTTTTKKPNLIHPIASMKPEMKTTTTTTTQSSLFPDPWGLLKVSRCNIYGKVYEINEEVEILSAACSHCVCTANGVECNDICKS